MGLLARFYLFDRQRRPDQELVGSGCRTPEWCHSRADRPESGATLLRVGHDVCDWNDAGITVAHGCRVIGPFTTGSRPTRASLVGSVDAMGIRRERDRLRRGRRTGDAVGARRG